MCLGRPVLCATQGDKSLNRMQFFESKESEVKTMSDKRKPKGDCGGPQRFFDVGIYFFYLKND